MFDQQGFFCPLSKIGISYKVKRGDPAGSPPVAGLTGFCNAITVFILPDHKLHVKQFLQLLQYMQIFLFDTILDNTFTYSSNHVSNSSHPIDKTYNHSVTKYFL